MNDSDRFVQILHFQLRTIPFRSQLGIVGIVIFVAVAFIFLFLFVFFLVWLLSKEDIGI